MKLKIIDEVLELKYPAYVSWRWSEGLRPISMSCIVKTRTLIHQGVPLSVKCLARLLDILIQKFGPNVSKCNLEAKKVVIGIGVRCAS